MIPKVKKSISRTNRRQRLYQRHTVLASHFLIVLFVLMLQLLLCFSCPSSTEEPSRNKVVLAIGAANSWFNTTQVESLSQTQDWTILEADLPEFGTIMKEEGSQASLDRYESMLETLLLSKLQPDVIMVASKGLNVLTFLVSKGLWTGPSILLSPIPNSCKHIAPNENSDSSWERQWMDTMNVLVDNMVSPIVIGVGKSSDEQTLIVDMMEETQVCGNIVTATATQQQEQKLTKCPNWKLFPFPGGHGWKNQKENVSNVAMLIDKIFKMMRKITTRVVDDDKAEL